MLSVTLSVIKHLICGSNKNWHLNLNLIYETLWAGAGSGLLISMLEKFNWFFNNTVAIDMKINGSVHEEKSSFKILGLTFSSKLNSSSYIISIAKTASKKISNMIRSMKFLSPEVALYRYTSTIRPRIEYCCRAWAGAPSCYLDLLEELQKRICTKLLALHLLPLSNP